MSGINLFKILLLISVITCNGCATITPVERGNVLTVIDADTVAIVADNTPRTLHIAYMDAPENGQPYTNQAKQVLFDLTFDKTVEFTVVETLSATEQIATLRVGNVDVATELVRRGLAWVLTGAPSLLQDWEKSNRSRRVGLWADPRPIPPWVYRQGRLNKK